MDLLKDYVISNAAYYREVVWEGAKMRYCYYCKKPMYTSNFSVWVKGKNYDAHSKCISSEKTLKSKGDKK